jgi:RES domain-containing protein
MLEKLTAGSGSIPPNQHFITITIPPGVRYEIVSKDHLPGWDTPDPTASRVFGATWVREQHSAILFVPSYVARVDRSVLINSRIPRPRRSTPRAPSQSGGIAVLSSGNVRRMCTCLIRVR